jgi:hypothetical protein
MDPIPAGWRSVGSASGLSCATQDGEGGEGFKFNEVTVTALFSGGGGRLAQLVASVTELRKKFLSENIGEIAIFAPCTEGFPALRKYSLIERECGTSPPAGRAGASRRTPFTEPVAGVWVTGNRWQNHQPLANSRCRYSIAVHPASDRTTRPFITSCNPSPASGPAGQLMPTCTNFPRGKQKPVVKSTPPLLIFTVRPCSGASRVRLPCHFHFKSRSMA